MEKVVPWIVIYFLFWYTLNGYIFNDCVLISPPKTSTVTDGNGDSMVFMLFSRKKENEEEILVFCHPGYKEWRIHKFPDDGEDIRSMCYLKGKLQKRAMVKNTWK